MNSNMGLFEEDCNMFLDDMEWNVESMFSAENPLEPDFDLSSTAQDVLQSGNAFLDSSDMLFNSNGVLQSSQNHISPRGIAEISEQESSHTKEKETTVQRDGIQTISPETVSLGEDNRQQNETNNSEENLITFQPNSFAFHQREEDLEALQPEKEPQEIYKDSGTDLTETAFRPEGAVGEEAEANILGSFDAAEFQSSGSQPVHQPLEARTQNCGDDPDTALHAGVPFRVSVGSHEALEKSYQTNNTAGDAIESLVQLPGHVRFSGDFEALLPAQPLSAPAGDSAAQELLSLQVPHQELLTNSTPPPSHVDLSSAIVAGNYDHSPLYPVGPEHVAPSGLSAAQEAAVQEAVQFMQTTTGFLPQNQIPSSPGFHVDTQTMQEVIQAYHSNTNHGLQPEVMMNQRAHTQGAGSSDFPVSSQQHARQNVTTSAGLDQRLSVRPTEGIVKKRGRKKTTRDPAKPPPTPRRKKSCTELEPVEDNASRFLVNTTQPSSSQRHSPQVSAAMPSTGGFEVGSPSHYRPQAPKRPSTSRVRGARASAVDDVQPTFGQNSENPQTVPAQKAKGAGPSSSKNVQAVESGRVAKKPVKKGGRVNVSYGFLSLTGHVLYYGFIDLLIIGFAFLYVRHCGRRNAVYAKKNGVARDSPSICGRASIPSGEAESRVCREESCETKDTDRRTGNERCGAKGRKQIVEERDVAVPVTAVDNER